MKLLDHTTGHFPKKTELPVIAMSEAKTQSVLNQADSFGLRPRYDANILGFLKHVQ